MTTEPSSQNTISLPDAVSAVLLQIGAGGEVRDSQQKMFEAVEKAVNEESVLVVEAGTGTGKSLGYLIPSVISGKKIVVTTFSKVLQQQLMEKDLPMLDKALQSLGRYPLLYTKLVGASNYICKSKIESEELDLTIPGVVELIEFDDNTITGERSELEEEPEYQAWSAVSVEPGECTGKKCSKYYECYITQARWKAADSDVIVANEALYGAHLSVARPVMRHEEGCPQSHEEYNEDEDDIDCDCESSYMTASVMIPAHEVVVLDEAHRLPDAWRSIFGFTLSPRGAKDTLTAVGKLLAKEDGEKDGEEEWKTKGKNVQDDLTELLAPYVGKPILLEDVDEEFDRIIHQCNLATEVVNNAIDSSEKDSTSKAYTAFQDRCKRIGKRIKNLQEIILDIKKNASGEYVLWVDGSEQFPLLTLTPINLDAKLSENFWPVTPTVVLCSATMPHNLEDLLGLPEHSAYLDVEPPFDYKKQGIIFIPEDMPPPGETEKWQKASLNAIMRLLRLSKGRSLVLHTSYAMMDKAYEAAVAAGLGNSYTLLRQGDIPKEKLINAFTHDINSILFATASFWEGVSVDGESLTTVIIDRLPFPRPGEPIIDALRARAGDGYNAFMAVDVPIASTRLAQGVGRLIRTTQDKGVVAVLDTRLAEKGYRHKLLESLPDFKRVRSWDVVEKFYKTL